MGSTLALTVLIASTWHLGPSEAATILNTADVRGGLVVHLGCGPGELTLALAAGPQFLVQGLEVNPALVAAAAERACKAGRHGQVTVKHFDGRHLPYNDNLVRLLVVEKPFEVTEAEMRRVVCPAGVILKKTPNGWLRWVKPWPAEIDQWTHFLHGPDNNAVVNDTVVAAPRGIQWVAKPLWARGHEQLASVSAAVTANGRLFYIIDEGPLDSIRYPPAWRLVARDAFSGVLLWKRPMGTWTDPLRHFRAGPLHLPRRLVAEGDSVYVTLGLDQPVSRLDAATGRTLQTYDGTEFTEEIVLVDGVLYLAVGSSEVHRYGPGLSARGEPEPTDFRRIVALRADDGRCLWQHDFSREDFLLPLSLTVRDGRVFYKSTQVVGCLDAATGKSLWRTPAETPRVRMAFSGPTVIATEEVLLCADREVTPETASGKAANAAIQWGVGGWNVDGVPRRVPCKITAYDVQTGRELWSQPCQETYNSPVDVFVVGDTVWVGTSFKGYDLRTGQEKGQLNWQGGKLGMSHHRCYRNKASVKYLFSGRSGVELVSFDRGWLGNNSWIRGTCQYGILPANGLLYAPPDACACFHLVKKLGFFAATTRPYGPSRMPDPDSDPLHRGPAFGQVELQQPAAADSWPVYRHDPARSGTSATKVDLPLRTVWEAAIGGRLTQPVVAYGKVLVVSIEKHTLHALDEQTGKQLWRFVAPSRIDSPPVLYRGLVIFGSSDGHVYCLRAEDGQLVWRFRAAPQDRQVVAFGRLESIWPVHGAVLVADDSIYALAGRNSYLDGGMVFCRLDPLTGRLLQRRVLYHLDPQTGQQIGWEDRKIKPFDMEGVRSDVLSSDGRHIFLKHMVFDTTLNDLAEKVPHLFSIGGFLLEEWFIRAYWAVAPEMYAGWGGWNRMGNVAPAGRILCVDGARVYGYGRKEYGAGPTGHWADQYQLFAAELPARTSAKQPSAAGTRRRRQAAEPQRRFLWTDEQSPVVRAMAVAGDKLLVAGPPNLGKRSEQLLVFENPREAIEAFLGKHGVVLQVRNVADGRVLAETPLPALVSTSPFATDDFLRWEAMSSKPQWTISGWKTQRCLQPNRSAPRSPCPTINRGGEQECDSTQRFVFPVF